MNPFCNVKGCPSKYLKLLKEKQDLFAINLVFAFTIAFL